MPVFLDSHSEPRLLWKGGTFPSTEGLEELVKQKGFLDGVYAFEYYPSTPGKYSIAITWGGHHIPKR